MGIEPTQVVWDTNKEWPLTGIGRGSLKDRSWPTLRLLGCPLALDDVPKDAQLSPATDTTG